MAALFDGMLCSYCGGLPEKPMKVGPRLIYCNDLCFAKDCIERHPGTSLEKMVKKMWPEVSKL